MERRTNQRAPERASAVPRNAPRSQTRLHRSRFSESVPRRPSSRKPLSSSHVRGSSWSDAGSWTCAAHAQHVNGCIPSARGCRLVVLFVYFSIFKSCGRKKNLPSPTEDITVLTSFVMLLCVQRVPSLPSVMVTGEMRVPDDAEVSEGPCNQAVMCSVQPWDSFENLSCIHDTFQQLNASGWYWGNISASQAGDALAGTSEGTFLVRDSSHTHYFFTLSVKTNRGPTNVRIGYSGSRFRLDYSSSTCPGLLSFPSVSDLVQHYVGTSRRQKKPKPEEDASAAVKDNAVLLKLRQPLYKPKSFPTLQHMVRLTINRHTTCPEQLPLPHLLLLYLQDYPFKV